MIIQLRKCNRFSTVKRLTLSLSPLSAMNSEPFQAPTLEELAPLFPKYSIDAFIAKGGMGAVYLATQISLERQVAIKILPRELGKDQKFRESFAAEAKAMAKLNHPNLIGVYDFGEVDGMPFIVMEYVAGKPLHDSAYGKQIDPMEAARIVLETCQGLHHAHEHDLLHRDVKPANILLDPVCAEAKLGDFGLAMATSGQGDGGLIYGTPGYAAPEVYEGKPDERSDVYAAAVILYQLITGQMPDGEYQHPSTLSTCDQRFDPLLAKALQPDANHRHQSAQELADELEAIRKGPAEAAAAILVTVPETHQSIASPTLSSNSGKGPLIGAIAALAAVGAGAFFFINNKEEEKPNELANSQTTEATEPIETPSEDIPQPEPIILGQTESPSEEIPTPEIVEPEEPQTSEEEPVIAEVAKTVEETAEVETETQEEEEPVVAMKEVKEPIEPATVVETPVSTFDHLAFLKRGRNFFIDKANKTLKEHSDSLLKNIDSLERKGKSILRDEYITRETKRARKDNLEATMEGYRRTGRLPGNLIKNTPDSLNDLTYQDSLIEKAIRDALDEQKEADLQLEDDLRPFSKSYANGIRKQSVTLKNEENDFDAKILEEEAYLAQTSFPYFLRILKGEAPLPPSLQGSSTNQQGSSLGKLIVGKWEMRNSPITFVIANDNTAISSFQKKPGTWSLKDNTIIIDWGNHKDQISFEEGQPDQFKCVNLSNNHTNTFTRILLN